jgi:hypothetical protein
VAQKAAQKDALNGLLHMRERSEATASGAGRRGCQGNRWIKSGCRVDLEGVSRPLRARRGALAGAREARGGLSQSRRTILLLLTRHSKTLLAKGQYLSSPSQNLNLRPSSIWLSEGENHLRTWPPRVRSSVDLRTRKGPCRTPSGRLFGPAGRLFRPGGHGHFKVALMSARPCLGRTPKQVSRGPKPT